jgi:hypothetical protein
MLMANESVLARCNQQCTAAYGLHIFLQIQVINTEPCSLLNRRTHHQKGSLYYKLGHRTLPASHLRHQSAQANEGTVQNQPKDSCIRPEASSLLLHEQAVALDGSDCSHGSAPKEILLKAVLLL